MSLATLESLEVLTKQTRLLQSILDNMGEGVIVADAGGNIMMFNPTAERIFGPGLVQRQFAVFADELTTEPCALPLERCLRGDVFDDLELLVRHAGAPAGTWVRFNGRPLRDAEAGGGAVLVCQDISERKKAQQERARVEQALRDSEALYESLVESLPQNIFRKDRAGRVTFGNWHYCQTLKMPLATLLGKTDFDLFPAELAAKYVRDDQRVLETGVPLETVERHQLPDGSEIFVQVVKTPFYDADGIIIGVQGIFWDVTEQKRAENILADSERRYRELTEATLDGIVLVDQAGCITLFNPAAERMFGYRAREVLGRQVTLLIPEALRPQHEAGFERYLETRQARLIGRTIEVQGRRHDGSLFPVEISLTALQQGPGEPGKGPLQFLAALRDLTERNKIRGMLVQSEKLASIGLLSAGVAHEINNPLAFVGNNLAVLERDCTALLPIFELLDANAGLLARAAPNFWRAYCTLGDNIDLTYVRANMERLLERTRDGVARVTRIVQSLRGMARTEVAKPQPASLAELVDGSLEILHGRFVRSGITVEQRHETDARPMCVLNQIGQVVLNLLMNAFQAVEARHIHGGRIDILTRQTGADVLLEIRDNGAGIAAENLPKIFDPFFTTKDVGEGTGLGLSISHNIVAAHGGRIEAVSEPGQGATFRVYLPLDGASGTGGTGGTGGTP